MLQETTTISSGIPKSLRHRWWILAIFPLLALGSGTAYLSLRAISNSASDNQTVTATAQIRTVTALGKLEPGGEVIKLSAPATSQINRVEQLLVKEGDSVKAGQVIAILDSRDRLQAAVIEASSEVQVAQAKLAQIQAGAKQGQIAAQQATIARLSAQRQGDFKAQAATVARLQAEEQNAEVEYQRYETLYKSGAISASQRDSKHLTLETAHKNLQQAQTVLDSIRLTSPPELAEAKSTLAQIVEVRPVDIAEAQAEVKQGLATVNQAKANLDQAYVKSPKEGTVLYIHTRPGEVVSNDGIIEIGQTRQMYAVAEVYQTDVSKVQPGQQVQVTSDSLPGVLNGTVDWIGYQVRRQNIVNTDPSDNIDARVVEVHVQLDEASSQKAAKFTNLQVKVTIDL